MSQKPAGAYKPRDPMTLQSVLAYEGGPRADPRPEVVGVLFQRTGLLRALGEPQSVQPEEDRQGP